MANWYNELKEIEKKEKIEGIAFDGKLYTDLDLIKEKINYEFDDNYGKIEGFAFTVWTKDKVYFPSVYDGAESIECVPRNPCSMSVMHIGGGG